MQDMGITHPYTGPITDWGGGEMEIRLGLAGSVTRKRDEKTSRVGQEVKMVMTVHCAKGETLFCVIIEE